MKQHPHIILNRALPETAESGQTAWVHLAPVGEFPGWLIEPEGRERSVTQRLDAEAFEAILRNFEPHRLVDFEHRADAQGGDTTAAAWILALDRREDGVWGQVQFSDLGAAAVSNRRYRYLSPVFDVELLSPDVARPTRLVGAAFTNRPNLKALKPLFNQAAAATQNTGGREDMKDIALALGLAEDADAAAILAAAQKLAADLAAANAKIAELETAGLEAEAETFVAENKARIKDPAAVKKQYVANKAATVALFGALAAPAPTIHNRAEAKTPAGGSAEPESLAARQQKLVAEIRNRDRCDYKRAFNTARRERPELFKEEAKQD